MKRNKTKKPLLARLLIFFTYQGKQGRDLHIKGVRLGESPHPHQL